MSSFTPLRMTYREACKQAIRDALLADPRCFVVGEDVGKYGGCYAVTKGLLEEFGPQRIRVHADKTTQASLRSRFGYLFETPPGIRSVSCVAVSSAITPR